MENATQPFLRYSISENENPFELLELTNSLLALGDEYKVFLKSHPGFGSPKELKLYFREIRTGSVIVDLIGLAPLMLMFAEHSNSVIKFGEHLANGYRYFIGKTKDKPLSLDRRSFENFSRIVQPVATDSSSQLNISTLRVEGDVVLSLDLSSAEANLAQNVIRNELAAHREPTSNHREKAVMYWYQVRDDLAAETGDKGIIESITNRPIKIDFATPEIKKSMIYGENNPLRRAHVVDVDIETVQGQPVLYKIVRYHGTLGDFIGEKDKGSALICRWPGWKDG